MEMMEDRPINNMPEDQIGGDKKVFDRGRMLYDKVSVFFFSFFFLFFSFLTSFLFSSFFLFLQSCAEEEPIFSSFFATTSVLPQCAVRVITTVGLKDQFSFTCCRNKFFTWVYYYNYELTLRSDFQSERLFLNS